MEKTLETCEFIISNRFCLSSGALDSIVDTHKLIKEFRNAEERSSEYGDYCMNNSTRIDKLAQAIQTQVNFD